MKRESRIAICCGKEPYVIVVKRDKSIVNVFIVNELSELTREKRFEEVIYMDKDCPKELGLKPIDVEDIRLKRIACLVATLTSALRKGNGPH